MSCPRQTRADKGIAIVVVPQLELRWRNLTFLRAMRLQLVADARIHTYRCLHWPLRLFSILDCRCSFGLYLC